MFPNSTHTKPVCNWVSVRANATTWKATNGGTNAMVGYHNHRETRRATIYSEPALHHHCIERPFSLKLGEGTGESEDTWESEDTGESEDTWVSVNVVPSSWYLVRSH